MERALVLCSSKTGTTERFAEEIGDFLMREGIDSKVVSIFKFDPQDSMVSTMCCWGAGRAG